MTVSVRDVCRRAAFTCGLGALLWGASGCVSNGTYDQMTAERDALAAEKQSLMEERAMLEEQVSTLESANGQLTSALSATESKISELTGTYDALLANLENEVASGQIEIEQLRNGIRMNVSDEILFPSGSAQLDERGREVMRRVAAQLGGAPNPILVEGHTDNVPISSALASRYPTNWELAGARAASVVRLLESEGIDGKRMQAISNGQLHPRAPNDSKEGRARNRRIEIRLLPADSAMSATTPETPDVAAER